MGADNTLEYFFELKGLAVSNKLILFVIYDKNLSYRRYCQTSISGHSKDMMKNGLLTQAVLSVVSK